MKVLMMIGAAGSFALGLFAVANMASDIQMILAAVGIIGGLILVGITAVLDQIHSPKS